MIMKTKQNTADANIEKTIRKAQSFETTLVDIRKKNERRAWMVAGVSVFVSICLIGGLFYMLPLKEKVPYLVMADAYNGTATLARFSGDWQNSKITANEAINKSNVAHYVVARESYDYQLIALRDWITVFAMSDDKVASEYKTLMSKNNPDGPLVKYANEKSIRIKIFNVRLNSKDRRGRPNGAVVRFQRFIYDKSHNVTRALDNKVATLTFIYDASLDMDERYRIENPLGFQVNAYRVEDDYASASTPDSNMAHHTPGSVAAPNAASSAPAATLRNTALNIGTVPPSDGVQ